MSLNYEIARLISLIKLALKRRLKFFTMINYSNITFDILDILVENGGLMSYFIEKKFDVFRIKIYLKYNYSTPIFTDIMIISRPGRRVYWNLKKFTRIKHKSNFGGFFIVSTPKGLLTSDECFVAPGKVAGEVLLKIVF